MKRLSCAFGRHQWLYKGSVVGTIEKVHLLQCKRCARQEWYRHDRDDPAAPKGEIENADQKYTSDNAGGSK